MWIASGRWLIFTTGLLAASTEYLSPRKKYRHDLTDGFNCTQGD
jgi:hypothetical protein